ncbi:MAG: hypothetical protein AB7O59_05430 [Pirellulales bacterium]
MPMTRPRKIVMGIFGLVLLAILGLVASTLVISNDYPTAQTMEVTFRLPEEFTQVRNILMRTDATRQITTLAGDNDFLEEEWTKLGGGLDSLRLWKDWRLELRANLKVRSRDDYIERPEVTLKQVVNIKNDEVISTIVLDQGSKRLRQYELVTHYERDDQAKNTLVRLRLTQEILTTAPWFAHWIADNRVRASAQRQLANQERAIKQLIADNHDKARLLSLPALLPGKESDSK